MRGIVIFAATLAALAIAPQPAAAGDRGVGFRHFAPHAGAKFHRPHHSLELSDRRFAGKHRLFKQRHSGRSVGKHRHFEQRHFGRSGHQRFVFKFRDRGFGLKFGHVPQLKPHRFEHRHGPGGRSFGFDRPRGFERRRHGPALDQGRAEDPRRLQAFGHRLRSVEGRTRRGAPPEAAILERLEELGFRHVPHLLRGHGRHRDPS